VKHLHYVTKATPSRAAFWQDIVCYGSFYASEILSVFGENLAFVGYLSDKCDLPLEDNGITPVK
jgi:hypothetical protein